MHIHIYTHIPEQARLRTPSPSCRVPTLRRYTERYLADVSANFSTCPYMKCTLTQIADFSTCPYMKCTLTQIADFKSQALSLKSQTFHNLRVRIVPLQNATWPT